MDLQADGGPGTYSIVAADPAAGALGVAVQSRYFAVGPVVPWVRPGVGAIATQSSANVQYGPDGLDLLQEGVPPDEVVARLTAEDEGRETRQLGVVTQDGETAVHTGAECIPWAGSRSGEQYHCQGNLLSGPQVIDEMAASFERAEGVLADRLLAALEGAEGAGGDLRGSQSAAILVFTWDGKGRPPVQGSVDLRVDDHPRPVAELRRLYNVQCSYQLGSNAREMARDGNAEAGAKMAEALHLNPSDDLLLTMAAEVAYRGGDSARATELMQEAIRRNAKAVCYLDLFGADALYDNAFRRAVSKSLSSSL